MWSDIRLTKTTKSNQNSSQCLYQIDYTFPIKVRKVMSQLNKTNLNYIANIRIDITTNCHSISTENSPPIWRKEILSVTVH